MIDPEASHLVALSTDAGDNASPEDILAAVRTAVA